MSPLRHSTNIAARMGRWSARHRKTAIFGWLAFVVAAFAIGAAVGMQTIDQNDSNVGEARRADHIIRDGGFSLDEQTEYVLVQSKTQTVEDPAFRAVVERRDRALERFPQVTKLRSPLAPGNEGQISTRRPLGARSSSRRRARTTTPSTYIDSITARPTRCRRPPRLLRRRGRSASTGKALDEMFGSQLATRRADLDPDHARRSCCSCSASLVAAIVPLLLALTAVFATIGAGRAPEPVRPDGRVGLGGHPADRARRRRRLLALLHPPRARRAARREGARRPRSRPPPRRRAAQCSSRASR